MASTRKKSAASLPGLCAPTAPAVNPIEKFHNALALSRWALGIIRGHSLDSLRGLLNRREMEGIDAEMGHTIFFNVSIGSSLFELGDSTKVTKEALAAYDLRVVDMSAYAGKRNVKFKIFDCKTLKVELPVAGSAICFVR